MAVVFEALRSGKMGFPAMVRGVVEEVRLSCSQWRKEDEPSDGPPASGSVMTTAKVAPVRLLSSARLGTGAVSVFSSVSWQLH